MSKTDTLTQTKGHELEHRSLAVVIKSALDFLPSGGSLPADVWQKRHRFLLGLTWLHALLIALVGPVLGYDWEFSLDAIMRDATVLHTLGEGLIVALFAAVAAWGTNRRLAQATAVGFGLMSASAILVHLSDGYIELHFHFFVMLAFMALYQDWVPYLLAILYVAIHHGVIGVLWPQEVFNHTEALSAPWTWAGIHAFFVLWAAVGSVIAWRFNEKAFAQTKLILNAMGEGIFGLDGKGQVTFMNPAAGWLLGIEPKELIGKRLHEVFRHGGVFSETTSLVFAPLRDGKRHQATDALFWRMDGTHFPVDYASTPIFEREELTGVVVTFRDISKRKQGELALRESEERFRQIAENITEVFWVTDPAKNERLYISPAYRDVWGRDAGRAVSLSRSWLGFIHPEDLGRVLAAVMTKQVSGQYDEHYRIMRPDGSIRWIRDRAFPVRNEAGKVYRIIGIAEDTTARKQAEEKLQARFRELATLQDISQAILDSLDLKIVMERILDKALEIGGFDIGVIRVLDRAGEVLEPVTSRGYRDPENVQRHRRKLEGYTTGAGTAQVMVDKAVRVVDLTQTQGNRTFKNEGVHTFVVVPLRSHEDVLGVLQLGSRTQRDFGKSELRILEAIGHQAGIAIQKARLYQESKRAQLALAEKAEELARSNTELQHFAYIASHDLQEPLRMVASYVQLLERRYKGKLDSEADEFIGFAVDGSKRMQALINALLAYSRIGTNGKPFERTNCEELLAIALKNLQLAVQENQAAVTHDPLPTVIGDPTQLGQLFQNLIGNAIKFRGDKPPAVHVSAQRNGKEWYFSFRDHGIGIDPRFSERIFVIFQRLRNKEEYPGTGIGLALCKKIVERHGGRIWVESEPGKGATFRFTIPG